MFVRMAASRDWKRLTIGVYTCKREQRCYAAYDPEHGSRGEVGGVMHGDMGLEMLWQKDENI